MGTTKYANDGGASRGFPPCRVLHVERFFFSRIPKVLPAASHRPRLVRHAPPVRCHATDSNLALSLKPYSQAATPSPSPRPPRPPPRSGGGFVFSGPREGRNSRVWCWGTTRIRGSTRFSGRTAQADERV